MKTEKATGAMIAANIVGFRVISMMPKQSQTTQMAIKKMIVLMPVIFLTGLIRRRSPWLTGLVYHPHSFPANS